MIKVPVDNYPKDFLSNLISLIGSLMQSLGFLFGGGMLCVVVLALIKGEIASGLGYVLLLSGMGYAVMLLGIGLRKLTAKLHKKKQEKSSVNSEDTF